MNVITEEQGTTIMKLSNPGEGEDFVDAITIIDEGGDNTTTNGQQSNMQITEGVETEAWNIEDAEPLNYHDVEEDSDGEMGVPI